MINKLAESNKVLILELIYERHCKEDETSNWNPYIPPELCLPREEELGLLEDICPAVEAENKYRLFGKSAFKKYDEYRNRRAGISV